MTSYHALILDWHLTSTSPRLRLVATATTAQRLREIRSYDPAADMIAVLRADYDVDKEDRASIENEFTGSAEPAHICRMTMR